MNLRPPPIALVLGPEEFLAAQRLGKRVSWCACRGGAPNEAAMLRIADLLERGGFRGRRVRLAPPESMVLSALVELPPRESGAPLDQLAAAEMARLDRANPADFVARAIDVPSPVRTRGGVTYLASALRQADALPLVQRLESVGLSVEFIVPPGLALARAFAGQISTQGLVAAAEVSPERTCFLGFLNGRVVYQRTILIGNEAECTTRLARALDWAPDRARRALRLLARHWPAATPSGAPWLGEAHGVLMNAADQLARELHASSTFVLERYGRESLAEFVLAGAEPPGLEGRLAARIGAPAQLAWPVHAGRPGADFGAALGLIGPEARLDAVTPPSLKVRRIMRRRTRQAAVATIGAAGFAAAAWISTQVRAPLDVTALIREVAASDRACDQLSAEVAELKALGEQAVRSLKARRATADRVDWTPLLRALTTVAGESVVFTHLGLAPAEKGALVTMRGAAIDQAELSRFVLALESLEFFSRVELVETHAGTTGGRDSLQFTLTCRITEALR